MERSSNNYRFKAVSAKDCPKDLLDSVSKVTNISDIDSIRLWASDGKVGFQVQTLSRWFHSENTSEYVLKPSANNVRKDLPEINGEVAKNLIIFAEEILNTTPADEPEMCEAYDETSEGRVRAGRDRSRTPKKLVSKVDPVQRRANRRFN